NFWFVRSAVTLLEAGPEVATYYVATNGSDSNNGTTTNTPFATISKAAGLANPGNLIYVRDGLYNISAQVTLSRSGSPTQPIRLRAYPGEHPACSFTNEPSGSAGIRISGDCWQVYGLEIIHSGHNGFLINGSSNTVERCVIHESGDSGLNITASGIELAGFNLILNCDSYRNFDLGANGGNADGFTAKFIVGQSNIFRGCRSWNNSDDGWDFWRATNAILVDHCLTFSNGFNVFGVTTFAGDGNGFKMGGDYQAGPHHYIDCVSFGNRVNGFDQNNNTAGLTVDNCTAFNNGSVNFSMNHDSTNAPMVGFHVVRNNISMAGHGTDAFRTGALLTNNSWQVLSPAAATTDVLSIAGGLALSPRRDDGSLAETPLLRPIPGGRLMDRGTNNGTTFFGPAPDLGAYETPEW
ncbi:MAG TPA: right-handed parallel beta-helix repeat-containing protein, partial [Verrucomicrobiae bacterium]|nr:right-handed parallel beta-helix repeat-containing protein [Verrucomicrobiae bacterium]